MGVGKSVSSSPLPCVVVPFGDHVCHSASNSALRGHLWVFQAQPGRSQCDSHPLGPAMLWEEGVLIRA